MSFLSTDYVYPVIEHITYIADLVFVYMVIYFKIESKAILVLIPFHIPRMTSRT